LTVDGFVGIDPQGLVGLAARVESEAALLAVVGRTLLGIGGRHSCGDGGIGSSLCRIAEALSEAVAGMRWRAEVIAAGGAAPATPLEEFAAFAVFGGMPDTRQLDLWCTPPDPMALARMSPAQVAAEFRCVAPSIGEDLARTRPRLIGSLDGAPSRLRYLANRLLIQARIEELERQLADIVRPDTADWRRWTLTPSWPLRWYPLGQLTAVVEEYLREQIERYRGWIAEDRQILLFDPGGDGRVAEVFGNLESARHVAVVVPGMANDLDGFDSTSGLRRNAARLHHAAAQHGSDGATIAWLGYDTPDGADAALRGAAAGGTEALRTFLEGIDPTAEKHMTVVAHSYGSVLAGAAAATGLPIDDLVLVGSPGTTLENAGEALLRPGGRVWAALAPGDPVGAAISPSELPPWWLPGALGALWFAGDMINGPESLWHGSNPAADSFGATRFSTEGSAGHSDYFEEGSLANLALIMRGRYDEVDFAG